MDKLKDIPADKVIDSFETAICTVFVIDCGFDIFTEHLYSVVSIYKYKNKVNIRFGNKTQMESMVNCYAKRA